VASEETRERGRRGLDRRALIRRSAVVGSVPWAVPGSGNTLTYQPQDNGEPGASLDLASFTISGNQTVIATGTLAQGNLQVHDYQKDRSGC
jgi:hypothetical protein